MVYFSLVSTLDSKESSILPMVSIHATNHLQLCTLVLHHICWPVLSVVSCSAVKISPTVWEQTNNDNHACTMSYQWTCCLCNWGLQSLNFPKSMLISASLCCISASCAINWASLSSRSACSLYIVHHCHSCRRTWGAKVIYLKTMLDTVKFSIFFLELCPCLYMYVQGQSHVQSCVGWIYISFCCSLVLATWLIWVSFSLNSVLACWICTSFCCSSVVCCWSCVLVCCSVLVCCCSVDLTCCSSMVCWWSSASTCWSWSSVLARSAW